MPTEQPTEQTELTNEQSELIEKLNCLEFETSQLNRAYQLWKSYVENGKTPDWMTAAIRITYNDMIRSCLDTVLTIPADVPKAFSSEQLAQLEAAARQISGILGGQGTTTEPPPELLPMAEPEWSGPQMPVAVSPTSNGHANSKQPAIQQSQQEEERLRQLWANALVYHTTAPSPESLPILEPDWSGRAWDPGPEMPVDISPTSNGHAISEQPAIQQSQQEEETLRQLRSEE